MIYRVFIERNGVKIEKYTEDEKRAKAKTRAGWSRDRVVFKDKCITQATCKETIEPNFYIRSKCGDLKVKIYGESAANNLAEQLAKIYGEVRVYPLESD